MGSFQAAIIGCGKQQEGKMGFAIGHRHAAGMVEAFDDLELFAVDPNEENLADFATRFGLPGARCFASTGELYAAVTPRLVSVCTWPELHRPQVEEACEAGVDGVVCEKPLAVSALDVHAMQRAAKQKDVRLAVAHQRAYEPRMIAMKRLLKEHAIGHEVTLDVRIGGGWDMLHMTVHWFDLATWLFDAPIESVLGGLAFSGQERYRHAVEDESVVAAELTTGQQVVFVTGPSVPHDRVMTLRGSDGMIALDGSEVHLWNREGYRKVELPEARHTAFGALMEDMRQWIEGGEPAVTRVDRSAHATLAVLAACDSARTRRRVRLGDRYEPQFGPLEVLAHPPQWSPRLGRVVLAADPHKTESTTERTSRDGLHEALTRLTPASLDLVAVDQDPLGPEHVEAADALVIFHTQRESSEPLRRAMTRHVEAGKPLVVVHCGIGAYSDWPEFRRWLGRHWVWRDEDPDHRSRHPHEVCDLAVVPGADFHPGWDKARLPRDEFYTELRDIAATETLATGDIGDGPQPVAWRSGTHPNVAVWLPGHRADVWDLPVMVDGLMATLRAAGADAATPRRVGAS